MFIFHHCDLWKIIIYILSPSSHVVNIHYGYLVLTARRVPFAVTIDKLLMPILIFAVVVFVIYGIPYILFNFFARIEGINVVCKLALFEVVNGLSVLVSALKGLVFYLVLQSNVLFCGYAGLFLGFRVLLYSLFP